MLFFASFPMTITCQLDKPDGSCLTWRLRHMTYPFASTVSTCSGEKVDCLQILYSIFTLLIKLMIFLIKTIIQYHFDRKLKYWTPYSITNFWNWIVAVHLRPKNQTVPVISNVLYRSNKADCVLRPAVSCRPPLSQLPTNSRKINTSNKDLFIETAMSRDL